MLKPGHDILGVMLAEQRLGRLRERLMEDAIAGRPADPAAVAEAERAALAAAWDELTRPEPQALFGAGPAGPRGDAGRLGQAIVLEAHRALLAIPVVGDPRLAEGR